MDLRGWLSLVAFPLGLPAPLPTASQGAGGSPSACPPHPLLCTPILDEGSVAWSAQGLCWGPSGALRCLQFIRLIHVFCGPRLYIGVRPGVVGTHTVVPCAEDRNERHRKQ